MSISSVFYVKMLLMKLLQFLKNETSGWGRFERIFFPLAILLIISISLYLNDSKIALISAICGVSYSILAGKGKISCYLFGLTGTFCYSYLSFKNALYGNLFLYLCCYFPGQIIGIFKWRRHLKPKTGDIVKTQLSQKDKTLYLSGALVLSVMLFFILAYFNDTSPVTDAVTSVFSVFGLILTVKRCIEQWHVWFIVNFLSVVMWIRAYMLGSNCFATILMWSVYLILTVYFYNNWKQEISAQNN